MAAVAAAVSAVAASVAREMSDFWLVKKTKFDPRGLNLDAYIVFTSYNDNFIYIPDFPGEEQMMTFLLNPFVNEDDEDDFDQDEDGPPVFKMLNEVHPRYQYDDNRDMVRMLVETFIEKDYGNKLGIFYATETINTDSVSQEIDFDCGVDFDRVGPRSRPIDVVLQLQLVYFTLSDYGMEFEASEPTMQALIQLRPHLCTSRSIDDPVFDQVNDIFGFVPYLSDGQLDFSIMDYIREIQFQIHGHDVISSNTLDIVLNIFHEHPELTYVF